MILASLFAPAFAHRSVVLKQSESRAAENSPVIFDGRSSLIQPGAIMLLPMRTSGIVGKCSLGCVKGQRMNAHPAAERMVHARCPDLSPSPILCMLCVAFVVLVLIANRQKLADVLRRFLCAYLYRFGAVSVVLFTVVGFIWGIRF